MENRLTEKQYKEIDRIMFDYVEAMRNIDIPINEVFIYRNKMYRYIENLINEK